MDFFSHINGGRSVDQALVRPHTSVLNAVKTTATKPSRNCRAITPLMDSNRKITVVSISDKNRLSEEVLCPPRFCVNLEAALGLKIEDSEPLVALPHEGVVNDEKKSPALLEKALFSVDAPLHGRKNNATNIEIMMDLSSWENSITRLPIAIPCRTAAKTRSLSGNSKFLAGQHINAGLVNDTADLRNCKNHENPEYGKTDNSTSIAHPTFNYFHEAPNGDSASLPCSRDNNEPDHTLYNLASLSSSEEVELNRAEISSKNSGWLPDMVNKKALKNKCLATPTVKREGQNPSLRLNDKSDSMRENQSFCCFRSSASTPPPDYVRRSENALLSVNRNGEPSNKDLLLSQRSLVHNSHLFCPHVGEDRWRITGSKAGVSEIVSMSDNPPSKGDKLNPAWEPKTYETFKDTMPPLCTNSVQSLMERAVGSVGVSCDELVAGTLVPERKNPFFMLSLEQKYVESNQSKGLEFCAHHEEPRDDKSYCADVQISGNDRYSALVISETSSKDVARSFLPVSSQGDENNLFSMDSALAADPKLNLEVYEDAPETFECLVQPSYIAREQHEHSKYPAHEPLLLQTNHQDIFRKENEPYRTSMLFDSAATIDEDVMNCYFIDEQPEIKASINSFENKSFFPLPSPEIHVSRYKNESAFEKTIGDCKKQASSTCILDADHSGQAPSSWILQPSFQLKKKLHHPSKNLQKILESSDTFEASTPSSKPLDSEEFSSLKSSNFTVNSDIQNTYENISNLEGGNAQPIGMIIRRRRSSASVGTQSELVGHRKLYYDSQASGCYYLEPLSNEKHWKRGASAGNFSDRNISFRHGSHKPKVGVPDTYFSKGSHFSLKRTVSLNESLLAGPCGVQETTRNRKQSDFFSTQFSEEINISPIEERGKNPGNKSGSSKELEVKIAMCINEDIHSGKYISKSFFDCQEACELDYFSSRGISYANLPCSQADSDIFENKRDVCANYGRNGCHAVLEEVPTVGDTLSTALQAEIKTVRSCESQSHARDCEVSQSPDCKQVVGPTNEKSSSADACSSRARFANISSFFRVQEANGASVSLLSSADQANSKNATDSANYTVKRDEKEGKFNEGELNRSPEEAASYSNEGEQRVLLSSWKDLTEKHDNLFPEFTLHLEANGDSASITDLECDCPNEVVSEENKAVQSSGISAAGQFSESFPSVPLHQYSPAISYAFCPIVSCSSRLMTFFSDPCAVPSLSYIYPIQHDSNLAFTGLCSPSCDGGYYHPPTVAASNLPSCYLTNHFFPPENQQCNSLMQFNDSCLPRAKSGLACEPQCFYADFSCVAARSSGNKICKEAFHSFGSPVLDGNGLPVKNPLNHRMSSIDGRLALQLQHRHDRTLVDYSPIIPINKFHNPSYSQYLVESSFPPIGSIGQGHLSDETSISLLVSAQLWAGRDKTTQHSFSLIEKIYQSEEDASQYLGKSEAAPSNAVDELTSVSIDNEEPLSQSENDGISAGSIQTSALPVTFPLPHEFEIISSASTAYQGFCNSRAMMQYYNFEGGMYSSLSHSSPLDTSAISNINFTNIQENHSLFASDTISVKNHALDVLFDGAAYVGPKSLCGRTNVIRLENWQKTNMLGFNAGPSSLWWSQQYEE